MFDGAQRSQGQAAAAVEQARPAAAAPAGAAPRVADSIRELRSLYDDPQTLNNLAFAERETNILLDRLKVLDQAELLQITQEFRAYAGNGRVDESRADRLNKSESTKPKLLKRIREKMLASVRAKLANTV